MSTPEVMEDNNLDVEIIESTEPTESEPQSQTRTYGTYLMIALVVIVLLMLVFNWTPCRKSEGVSDEKLRDRLLSNEGMHGHRSVLNSEGYMRQAEGYIPIDDRDEAPEGFQSFTESMTTRGTPIANMAEEHAGELRNAMMKVLKGEGFKENYSGAMHGKGCSEGLADHDKHLRELAMN